MSEITMLKLVNSTDSVWKKVSETFQGMESISFPKDPIENQRNVSASVIYSYNHSATFEVKYQLMHSEENTFIIRGRYKNELDRFDLELFLDNLETSNYKKGAVVSLGWKPDGFIHLILIGDVGNYIGPDINTEYWMQDHRNILGNLPINKLCITGSHDAGMSLITWKTTWAFECNTLTQSNNILGQLKLGIRYFDIRPVLSDGIFFTGHYKDLGVWEGSNGESLDSIIYEINTFTKTHNELIIIRLDHSLCLDVGILERYRSFKESEWLNLFYTLTGIDHLYYHNGTCNISDVTLNTLTDNGTHSAVLLFVETEDTNVTLQEYNNNGFFYLSELNMYHKYSNTSSILKLSSDQIKKMNDYAPTHYFELLWTLTQNVIQATTCATTLSSSIKQLADEANDTIEEVLPHIRKTVYPNIFLIDNVKDTVATTFVLAINWTVLSYK
ncbi:hypothetical protein [Xenorhabdus lircayensis]|uniref:Phosphatidylinositol diacylglycerol-lyase n=1 Tax=Xenorhabdus lircayensis TaxID=2763499 RepID=A0ABS0U2D8_9GAMM|nr:hypothetical protein [Xenorhabdus lircayensis]MBI6547777.1 hypothetical protein [Xenorhabdus lircayensis]